MREDVGKERRGYVYVHSTTDWWLGCDLSMRSRRKRQPPRSKSKQHSMIFPCSELISRLTCSRSNRSGVMTQSYVILCNGTSIHVYCRLTCLYYEGQIFRSNRTGICAQGALLPPTNNNALRSFNILKAHNKNDIVTTIIVIIIRKPQLKWTN